MSSRKQSKNTKFNSESSGDADDIHTETISTEEETSGTESSRSVTEVGTTSSEDTASDSHDSEYSAEEDYRRYRKRGEIRYVVIDQKGRLISESERPPAVLKSQSKKDKSKKSRKSKDRKLLSKKHGDKKKKSKEQPKKKAAATPRKRKEKRVEQTINEDDEPHIKLAKVIPLDIVTRLGLNKDTTIETVTQLITEKDEALFEKLTAVCVIIKKATFTVGSPSDNHFTYGDLYVCEFDSTESNVTRLERCLDMKTDESAQFRRLPHTFEKRNNMLELFNKHAPPELREKVALPSFKDKAIARMNFLLNDSECGAKLAVPVEGDPCSEVCIVKSDGSDNTPVKVVCIWQANVIRENKLICVKPKADVRPAKSEIDKVVLARIALFKMLTDFIDSIETEKEDKKKQKKQKTRKTKEVTPTKRKRDESVPTKPEKKAKTETPIPIPVVQTAKTEKKNEDSSSTSTSESDACEMSEDGKPTIPQVAPQKEGDLPLWQSFIKEAKQETPLSTTTVTPSQPISAAQRLAEKRAALMNQYKNTPVKK